MSYGEWEKLCVRGKQVLYVKAGRERTVIEAEHV